MKTAKLINALLASALFAVALPPAPALAYKVYSPIITPGETALELWGEASGEHSINGNKQPESKRATAELRHTFFERLDLGFGLVAESGANVSAGSEGESMGFSRVKLRGLYQVTEKNAHFIDAGIYVDYQNMQGTVRNTTPDYLNVLLLFEKDFDAFSVSLNPGVRKTLSYIPGKQDNIATYQAGFKYRWRPLFNPGVEIFGIDLGPWDNFRPNEQQRHNGGPMFSGRLPDIYGYTVHYEGALLFGLTTYSTGMIANGVLEIRF